MKHILVLTLYLLFNSSGLMYAQDLTKFFDKKRPVCIVLIHGITNSRSTNIRLINEGKAPRDTVNSLRFSRHYWSYEFVQGLLGLESDKIYTFSDDTPAGELNATIDGWENKHSQNSIFTDYILTGCGIPPKTGPTGSCVGFVTIMMTHRDGSLSLKQQTADAASQIKRLYDEIFGLWPEAKQPQLILLCHSGGGLVARTICSKPHSLGGGISSLLNSPIPVERFSRRDLDNMEFIRNRTLYIITLSTPHEGAPIAKVANQYGQFISGIGLTLAGATFGLWNPFQDVTDQDPQILILKELCPNIMFDYNKGPLNPVLNKRSDGSLIPIYCLGGRTATWPYYFKDPNEHDNDLSSPDGGIPYKKDEIKTEHLMSNGFSNRKEYESYGLLQADYLTTLLYGITSMEMVVPELLLSGITGKSSGFDLKLLIASSNNSPLDIVNIRNIGLTGCLDLPVYNLIDFAAGARLFYLRDTWLSLNQFGFCTGRFQKFGTSTEGDGLIDCDGFVPIKSSLGVNLGTEINDFFDHTDHGSWYRFYRSAADYDNHGSIMQRIEVANFVRQKITGIAAFTNLFNQGIVEPAAGPIVSTVSRSVWPQTVDISEPIKLPISFNLEQNYPNPFNPTTTISYSIPVTSFITLKVYDILGREVTTLINEEKPAGTYNLNFNASNLTSGVYFYKMKAGEYASTKRMVLIR